MRGWPRLFPKIVLEEIKRHWAAVEGGVLRAPPPLPFLFSPPPPKCVPRGRSGVAGGGQGNSFLLLLLLRPHETHEHPPTIRSGRVVFLCEI